MFSNPRLMMYTLNGLFVLLAFIWALPENTEKPINYNLIGLSAGIIIILFIAGWGYLYFH